MPKWLRWLSLLPAALLAMILSSFPLHFVLYQTLTGSGIVEPYPETPERLLLPLVGAMAFIWGGANVAPSHKVRVASVLLALWIIVLGALVVIVLSGNDLGGSQFHLRGKGVAPAMALIGAIAGFLIVLKQNANKITTADQ